MNNQSASTVTKPPCVIRVFVSSTFRDMQAERSHLVENVFPRLRSAIEPYGIFPEEIDLRWGVSKEQAENDRVIETCLDEVDRCRPFFIGILGNRYGSVPDHLNDKLVAKFGWLKKEEGKSITELEILHGAIRNPGMHNRALFYFRNSQFINDIPLAKKSDFIDDKPEMSRKLDALKQKIIDTHGVSLNYNPRYGGFRINRYLAKLELDSREWKELNSIAPDGLISPATYQSLSRILQNIVNRYGYVQLDGLEEFGQSVLDGLLNLISLDAGMDLTSPRLIKRTKDPFIEQQNHMDVFIESHLRAFAGRQQILQYLFNHVHSNDPKACLVSGPEGCGKTAILAKFVRDYQDHSPNDLVFSHFFGASPESHIVLTTFLRFSEALRQHLGIPPENIYNPKFSSETFALLLMRIPGNRRVVFVIDGIDRFPPEFPGGDLKWLPDKFPPNVKFIFSCTDPQFPSNPFMKSLLSHQLVHCPVEPLSLIERKQILKQVPSLAGKTLDNNHEKILLDNVASANPLFLLTSLSELRGLSSSQAVSSYLQHLPRRDDSLGSIYDQVLDRLEIEYDPQQVKNFFAVIASTRYGLPETDLIRLCHWLSGKARSYDRGGYLQVYPDIQENLFEIIFSMKNYFYHLGGFLEIYHPGFLEKIRRRYLSTPEFRRRTHLLIADYFQRQKLDSTEPFADREWLERRVVSEVPWHLAEAGEWQRLVELLGNISFLTNASSKNSAEVRSYWTRIERHSRYRMANVYRPLFSNPAQYRIGQLEVVARLLGETGHPREQNQLQKIIRAEYQRRGEIPGMKHALWELLTGAKSIKRQTVATGRERQVRKGFQFNENNIKVIIVVLRYIPGLFFLMMGTLLSWQGGWVLLCGIPMLVIGAYLLLVGIKIRTKWQPTVTCPKCGGQSASLLDNRHWVCPRCGSWEK